MALGITGSTLSDYWYPWDSYVLQERVETILDS